MSRLRTLGVVTVGVVLALPVGAAPARAAGSVVSAVSLTAPGSGSYGSVITLRGRLWRYGTPYGITRSKVWLQRTPHGRAAWTSIGAATTGSNGGYAFRVTQTGAYDYRVYYGGSVAFRAALSPVRYPVTNQVMAVASVVTANATTGVLRATGYVYPRPPDGRLVHLQRWDPEGRVWHGIGSGRTSGGRVIATAVRPGSVDSYRLVVPARSPYGAGVSAARSFAHFVWRGAFARGGVVYSNGTGTFAIPKASENPRRDTIVTYVGAFGWHEFAVDPAGCRHVATSTRWDYGGGALPMRLTGSSIVDEKTLAMNSTVAMSGAFHPADPRLYSYLGNPQDGAASTTTRMALLCTN
jgi:hypothetical protein